MKKPRNIKTFEPESDVLEMLETAKEAGLDMGEVVNKSVREYGKKVIRKIAENKMGKLRSLVAESFSCGERQFAVTE